MGRSTHENNANRDIRVGHVSFDFADTEEQKEVLSRDIVRRVIYGLMADPQEICSSWSNKAHRAQRACESKKN